MPKSSTIFFLAFIPLSSFAQKSTLDKSVVKNLKAQLSYIPARSFNILAYKGNDSVSFYKERITTVHGFYLNRTEVTNKEYREFVFYVRDSIAHHLLSHFREGTGLIDWNKPLDWNDDKLAPLLLTTDERLFTKKEINPAKLIYSIDFFGQPEILSIYPDTLVWMRDFNYSYNEPLTKKYFSYSFYDHYPVVGISQKQAMAFCQWKTGQIKKLLTGKDVTDVEVIVKLPTNAEWESAVAKKNDSATLFSVSKPYNCNFGIINDRDGLTLKGFKDDGYFYTAPVKSFPPGPNGLYDMKGNIAEWTLTAREEIMNAEMKPEKMKTVFIVKGGGWNSTPFYLQPGVCQFFPADAAHSFVGFRYVVHIEKK